MYIEIKAKGGVNNGLGEEEEKEIRGRKWKRQCGLVNPKTN